LVDRCEPAALTRSARAAPRQVYYGGRGEWRSWEHWLGVGDEGDDDAAQEADEEGV
jgi:hypothetical protein